MHANTCACRICQWIRAGFTPADAADLAATEEHTIIGRVGWSVRAYLNGPWAETAGLLASFGHPEFQMRLDVDPRDRQRWLNVFGRAVAQGRAFRAPSTVPAFFSVPVRLVPQDTALMCVSGREWPLAGRSGVCGRLFRPDGGRPASLRRREGGSDGIPRDLDH